MKMNALFAAVALTLALAVSAHAATSTAKSTKPAAATASSAAEAKAALARLAGIYKAAHTLSYSSTVTMAMPGSSVSTIAVKGSIERPNLIRMEIDSGGKMTGLIVSDGTTSYAFDATGNRYTKSPATGSGPAALLAPLAAGAPLIGTPVAEAMFTTAMFVSPEPYDLTTSTGGERVHLSAAPAVLDGRPVTHVVEEMPSQGSTVTLDLYLDKATGLPARVAEDVTQNGKTMEPLREDFATIQASAAPLVASNFAWTPPAGATVFTPPASNQADADTPALAAGTPAPDFDAQTPDGKDVHLSDFKGKVVVLDFWATWCGPCQMSLPRTDKLAQAYQAKGVVFLPICTWDDKTAFEQWVGQHKSMSMQFYFDPAAKDDQSSIANKLYGVQGIPTQYVVGKDGKIVAGFVGYDPSSDPDEKSLQQTLDKALAAS